MAELALQAEVALAVMASGIRPALDVEVGGELVDVLADGPNERVAFIIRQRGEDGTHVREIQTRVSTKCESVVWLLRRRPGDLAPDVPAFAINLYQEGWFAIFQAGNPRHPPIVRDMYRWAVPVSALVQVAMNDQLEFREPTVDDAVCRLRYEIGVCSGCATSLVQIGPGVSPPHRDRWDEPVPDDTADWVSVVWLGCRCHASWTKSSVEVAPATVTGVCRRHAREPIEADAVEWAGTVALPPDYVTALHAVWVTADDRITCPRCGTEQESPGFNYAIDRKIALPVALCDELGVDTPNRHGDQHWCCPADASQALKVVV